MKLLFCLLLTASLASAQCPIIEGRAQNFYNGAGVFLDAFQVSVAPVDLREYDSRIIEVTVDGIVQVDTCHNIMAEACPVYYLGMNQSPWSYKAATIKTTYYTDSSYLACPVVSTTFRVSDHYTSP